VAFKAELLALLQKAGIEITAAPNRAEFLEMINGFDHEQLFGPPVVSEKIVPASVQYKDSSFAHGATVAEVYNHVTRKYDYVRADPPGQFLDWRRKHMTLSVFNESVRLEYRPSGYYSGSDHREAAQWDKLSLVSRRRLYDLLLSDLTAINSDKDLQYTPPKTREQIEAKVY
jgi:hypothetical protein